MIATFKRLPPPPDVATEFTVADFLSFIEGPAVDAEGPHAERKNRTLRPNTEKPGTGEARALVVRGSLTPHPCCARVSDPAPSLCAGLRPRTLVVRGSDPAPLVVRGLDPAPQASVRREYSVRCGSPTPDALCLVASLDPTQRAERRLKSHTRIRRGRRPAPNGEPECGGVRRPANGERRSRRRTEETHAERKNRNLAPNRETRAAHGRGEPRRTHAYRTAAATLPN